MAPTDGRRIISEAQRVYSEAEFAVILQKAAELAKSSGARRSSPTGLTLAEMKAAASEAGIDPALVERAARLLSDTASRTRYERLIGGPHVTVRSYAFLRPSMKPRRLSCWRRSRFWVNSRGQDIRVPLAWPGTPGMIWKD